MDSGGQYSAVEAALGSGATSAARLRRLALRQRLSIAHRLAATERLGVTLLIAGLVSSARHCTSPRVLQVPKAWGWSTIQLLLLLSRPLTRLSPVPNYPLLTLGGRQQELLNSPPGTLLQDPAQRFFQKMSPSHPPPPPLSLFAWMELILLNKEVSARSVRLHAN